MLLSIETGAKIIQIDTARFGPVSVEEDSVITLPDGILGLEENRRFVMLEQEDRTPFKWMQSLDDGDIAFVVADPFELFTNYEVEIGDDDLSSLGATVAEDIDLICLLTISGDIKEMTANLLAPIAVNVKAKMGKQLILTNSSYQTRHAVFDEKPAEAEDN